MQNKKFCHYQGAHKLYSLKYFLIRPLGDYLSKNRSRDSRSNYSEYRVNAFWEDALFQPFLPGFSEKILFFSNNSSFSMKFSSFQKKTLLIPGCTRFSEENQEIWEDFRRESSQIFMILLRKSREYTQQGLKVIWRKKIRKCCFKCLFPSVKCIFISSKSV